MNRLHLAIFTLFGVANCCAQQASATPPKFRVYLRDFTASDDRLAKDIKRRFGSALSSMGRDFFELKELDRLPAVLSEIKNDKAPQPLGFNEAMKRATVDGLVFGEVIDEQTSNEVVISVTLVDSQFVHRGDGNAKIARSELGSSDSRQKAVDAAARILIEKASGRPVAKEPDSLSTPKADRAILLTGGASSSAVPAVDAAPKLSPRPTNSPTDLREPAVGISAPPSFPLTDTAPDGFDDRAYYRRGSTWELWPEQAIDWTPRYERKVVVEYVGTVFKSGLYAIPTPPELVIRLGQYLEIQDYFLFRFLELEGSQRLGIDIKPDETTRSALARKQIAFSVERRGQDFKIKPAQPLTPGSYGILRYSRFNSAPRSTIYAFTLTAPAQQ